MRIKEKVKSLILNIDIYHQIRWLAKYEKKKINDKAGIWSDVSISNEDMKAIQDIYGKGIDVSWHKYFASFSGKMDPRYLPEILYSSSLEWRINPYRLCNELEDKALLPTLFGGNIRVPKTVLKKTYGRCANEKGEIIEDSQRFFIVREYLQGAEKAILKPTRDTSSGRGVQLLTLDNYQRVLSEVDDNYIIQQVIKNQDDVRCLNPSSLNTFRVMTYICNDRFNVAPVLLRMGVGSNVVDNAHAGGIFIGVNSDGTLCDAAYSEYGTKHAVHPTSKIVFAEHKIHGINLVEEAAIECHKFIPQFGMVSWDITLDEKGTPVLIEANLFGQSVWLPQIAHGKSIFGDDTVEMIKKLDNKIIL